MKVLEVKNVDQIDRLPVAECRIGLSFPVDPEGLMGKRNNRSVVLVPVGRKGTLTIVDGFSRVAPNGKSFYDYSSVLVEIEPETEEERAQYLAEAAALRKSAAMNRANGSHGVAEHDDLQASQYEAIGGGVVAG